MSEESKFNKSKVTPEQLKQFMQMQEVMKNKVAGQAGGYNTAGGYQLLFKNLVATFLQKTEKLQYYVNRFINFVTKETDADRNDVVSAARAPILFGTYVIGIFVIFGGIWMAFAPLNSAAVAIGTVISSTNKKIIQNAEQGIIKKILVKQGDKVTENQSLIELDEVNAKSTYENILYQYRMNLAAESRLIAERDGLDKITFPTFLMDNIGNPDVKAITQVQENLFKYRKQVIAGTKDNTMQKIKQAHKSIEGLQSKVIATKKNLEITSGRIKSIQGLADKKIIAKAHLLELEAREATLKGDVLTQEAEIARNEQEIARYEIELLNIDNDHLSKVLAELKEAQSQRAQAQEKYPAACNALEHIIIKSPVDGIINVLNVHTIGGVVGAGTTLLEISPANDSLIIEAKIDQKNIDSIKVGLVAKIRFSAFKSRTTPLFTGKVVSVSPDIVQDKNPQPGQASSYYIARIEINMDEFNKIAKKNNLSLQPGMQAEVQIITGTRTLLRYLLDPLTDTMFRAFKEK